MVFELQPGRYGKEELEAKFLCVTEAIKKVRPPAVQRSWGNACMHPVVKRTRGKRRSMPVLPRSSPQIPPSHPSLSHPHNNTYAQRTGLEVYRMVAVKDRTIPKTTSGKIRRKATKEALRLGTLWVLHDSMGLLPPGKGKGAGALISPTTPSSNGSSRSELSVRVLPCLSLRV